MRIRELFDRPEPVVSFEFFPPKTDAGGEQLFRTIAELQPLNPSFVSVTYGAGGSTRRKTLEIVSRIKKEVGIEAMAHLTCVGHSRDEIRSILESLVDAGIENVLALRGDPPKGADKFERTQDGFGYASELVAFIRELDAPLCVGGACYPEVHPEAMSADSDLNALKAKVDAGVDFLVTQLFFNNSDYFEFVSQLKTMGIDLPIVPGIMPVTNYTQIKRFTDMCGASIPASLESQLESVDDSEEAVAGVGISHAAEQCRELLSKGAPGIHFYTLNKSPATRAIHALVFGGKGSKGV